MENLINDNAAEAIPYKNHKQKFIIVFQELKKIDILKFGISLYIHQINGEEEMIDYELGQKYRVSVLEGRNKTNNKITGELIHQNDRHFTLQSKRGIRESFLKVDFKTGEYGIVAM